MGRVGSTVHMRKEERGGGADEWGRGRRGKERERRGHGCNARLVVVGGWRQTAW